MTPEEIRKHITPIILSRLDVNPQRRAEALRDFLVLSVPNMDDKAIESVSGMVPELPREIYLKWINMFIDRLLETIPQDQLNELCNGKEDNNTALGLVYLMFMESARMEKQVAEDLARLGLSSTGNDAQADALSIYLQARLQQKKEQNDAKL